MMCEKEEQTKLKNVRLKSSLVVSSTVHYSPLMTTMTSNPTDNRWEDKPLSQVKTEPLQTTKTDFYGPKRRRRALGGLLIFFRIAYHIFFTPFKIVQFQGEFILHRSRTQTVIYTFMTLSAFIECIATVKSHRGIEMGQNSYLYFQLVSSLGTFAQQIFRTLMILMNSQLFPHICNVYLKRMEENERIHKMSAVWTKSSVTMTTPKFYIMPKTFTILMTVVMLLFFLTEYWSLNLDFSMNHFQTMMNSQRTTANDLLRPFYQLTPILADKAKGGQDGSSVTRIIENVFLIYMVFCRNVIRFGYLLSDALFLVILNFYGQLINDLVEHVQRDGATQILVLNQFRLLQELVKKINEKCGIFMAAAILGNATHFIHKVPSLLQSTQYFDTENANLAFYSAYYFGGLIYVARKYTTLEMCMKRWTLGQSQNGGSNQNTLRRDDVNFLFDLQWSLNMGLSMAGMHEINQGLLTSVISAVLAYSIIVISQFETGT